MYVELLVFPDVLTDAIKQDRIDELLRYGWLGRDENPGRPVYGIWGPVLGAGDVKQGRPVWEGGEDLEGLRERTGFVAGEEHANSDVGQYITLTSWIIDGIHTSRILPPPSRVSGLHLLASLLP